jgi:hypothetical protein
MLPQPSGAPHGIMWGFLGKKEGAGGLRALLSRKDTWEIRWVVIDDRTGAIIYGIISRVRFNHLRGIALNAMPCRRSTLNERARSTFATRRFRK